MHRMYKYYKNMRHIHKNIQNNDFSKKINAENFVKFDKRINNVSAYKNGKLK